MRQFFHLFIAISFTVNAQFRAMRNNSVSQFAPRSEAYVSNSPFNGIGTSVITDIWKDSTFSLTYFKTIYWMGHANKVDTNKVTHIMHLVNGEWKRTVNTFASSVDLGQKLNIIDTTNKWQRKGNYLTSISSANVISALGYTPYNSSNPNGYLSNISSSNVISALGYTPYNSTNPLGFMTQSSLNTLTNKSGSISQWTNDVGYITGIGWSDVSGKPTFANVSTSGSYNDLFDKPNLASVAISGSYNDLTNKPTIPASDTYSEGFGIDITGSSPNYTILVNQSDVMTVQRATDSISNINTKINGKVNNSRTISINGNTQDLSANRTWTLNSGNITESGNLYYTDARARASLSQGTGITYNNTTGQITNSAPDQTVTLTAGNGIVITGTYPNFTISLAPPTINNTPNRSVNSNFTISSTKPATVFYSITCTVTNPLLVGTSAGTAFLEYSIDGGTNWVGGNRTGNSSSVGVTVTVQLTNGQTTMLGGIVPTNALVRIRTTTSGTATVISVSGQEVVY